jgi:hypothetical protein
MAGNFLDDWYEDEDELTLYKPKSPTWEKRHSWSYLDVSWKSKD